MCWELFCLCCDKFEIKINNLFNKHMFVLRVSGFIYWNKGSKIAKCFFKSVDCLDTLYLQGDYFIGERVFGGRWLGFALWDEWTKMRKALINKLNIIIYLDYLQGIERHGNVW